ncbi:hypothetical protein Tsubulata_006898 [Turnera subulata]|uniref:pectinesterase n=1 Tax=Turnera subulata TaxID=218843 RepID=A0A9Q0GGN0_9ROSI|nr:hypothetical protein Tsubulata_006898 [Turnera subulata]
MDDIIVPAGCHAWKYAANESDITYAESNNEGPGADTSKRVTWEKNLTAAQLSKFIEMSFINSDKWLSSVPISSISI